MKEILGTLDFNVKFNRPNELENIGLPVEIRRPNLSLVKTGLTSEPLKLKPGKYLVISKMPAGQELLDHVEIKADEQSTAHLKLGEEEESPHETEALQHYLVANRQKVLSVVENFTFAEKELKSLPSRVQIRLFNGNLLSEETQQIKPNWQKREDEPGLLGFQIHGTNAAQIVQLLQTNAPPLNMILPAMREHDCRLFVTSLIQGKYTLDAHLENQSADLLLRYSNKGYYQQTDLLSQAMDAEKLLQRKVEDPFSAAVGAYALLRFNKLELLRDWTENLRNWFKWLPDGSATRGEHLARTGQHKDALRAFLEIEERGLPIFSDGFSYALDRLSAYVGSKADFVSSSDSRKAKSLLAKLQKFAAYTDFREPFTTFTGLDVNEPSAEPLKEIAEDEKALNLNLLF